MPRRLKITLYLLAAFLLYVGAIAVAGLSAKPAMSELGVVLGNEVLKDGTPSPRLTARLDCALDLYRRHLIRFIMVSGGVGKSGFSEALVMRKYLLMHGVYPEFILTDRNGINTMATAVHTAEIVKVTHFTHVVIITQYYHIPRTALAFWKAGVQGLSADYPRYFDPFDPLAILREAVALPVYFIKMPPKE